MDPRGAQFSQSLIIPGEVYGIAAAGRPIIAITSKNGEIARPVETYHCGIVVEPGNSDELVKAISRLSSDAEGADAMARRTPTMLEAQFRRRHAFERWKAVIDRIE